MRAILSLFGRSPFGPLQSHMKKVADCVHCLNDLFICLKNENYEELELVAKKISELEHNADLTKNDLRNHLPSGLFLPIDRSRLLEILSLQDGLADIAEDIAVLTTLKQLQIPPSINHDFFSFLKKNMEAFEISRKIIKEIHDLLESSFGGIEAQKVQSMVDEVALKEHEVDLQQRKILKHLFKEEDSMSYSTFHLWMRLIESIAMISNLSEKLANRIRMTLDVK